ncbi:MAG: Asp23/Gls24 family envelope stress response protein [Actinomycetota bacterium]|nr:Asp23/Gls24 family envelope stress response protein [Actinomycetota bacterium]
MAERPAVTARLAATAANEVPDVLDLYEGAVGEIATYGSGERVGGVRVRRGEPNRLVLYLVVRFGRPLAEIAEEVRDKVRQRLEGSWVIDVHIQDVRAEQPALESET